jgi:hypothetical protein
MGSGIVVKDYEWLLCQHYDKYDYLLIYTTPRHTTVDPSREGY